MPDLPTGTVTLLFTDIEGSTRLLQRLGPLYGDLLAEYRTLLRSIFQAHDGREVDTQGDSFFVAFPRAVDAVIAATEIQRALATHRGPEGVTVPTRMGLHTGEPQLRSEGYVGLDVHRAARVGAAGHGGQVLLSDATRVLVARDLPADVSLRDLGLHTLKDLQHPEHLFQLVVEGLSANFPPIKGQDTDTGARAIPLASNLPVQPTPFIGRERDIAAIRQRLLDPHVRLLTLTGPGGAGKTRLALQVAAEVLDHATAHPPSLVPDGVWLVELAVIDDPTHVASTIAQTLGIKEARGQSIIDSLTAYLGAKQLLLLLDNFEQVVTAATVVAMLLRAAPRLKIVVTSREPLHISGEHEYRVEPLGLPDPAQLPSLDRLAQYDAVRLFVERARVVRADFTLNAANAQLVAAICQRLDGLPLALELAAARVRLLPLSTLLARLDSRLQLLTGGPRDWEARQQTLRSTIDWSFSLLTPAEQMLLARLCVFVGGCTLEAAEAVCAIPGDPAGAVLDDLASLVDKNLVRRDEEADGEPRFRMLELIREYALERLAASDEVPVLRRQHADFYTELVEAAGHELYGGTRQLDWHQRLEIEHDNIRTVLKWALEEGAVEVGLRLGAVLWQFWMTRGYLEEGQRWLDAILDMSTQHEGDQPRTERLTRAYLGSLRGAGWLASEQSDYERAATLFERALDLAREVGNRKHAARLLADLAHTVRLQGDNPRAGLLFDESAVLAQELDDNTTLAFALGNRGVIAHAEGDDARAVILLQESLELADVQADRISKAWMQAYLGRVAKDQGNQRKASRLVHQSLILFDDLGNRDGIAFTLELFAGLAATQKNAPRAARLFGRAAALREEIVSPLAPFDRPQYDHDLASARAQLDEAAWQTAWVEGGAMSLEDAIAYALADEPSI